MTRFTFVHAADLHLDAPFRGVSDMLLSSSSSVIRPKAFEELARLLREATFIALRRLTELCIREQADALLLAGDIYNSADSSLRARLALRDAFVRLEAHGVRVFLVHGNHDPLSEEASAIPWPGNVIAFGSRMEVHPVVRQGETLALVHGVSHTGPREGKNLARQFKRRPPASAGTDVLQIGLLHCALTDLSGAHAPYAPCTFSDLAETGMDYWALGHVHVCRVLDHWGKALPGYFVGQASGPPDGTAAGPEPGQPDAPPAEQPAAQPREHAAVRPFAAYPGSLQGLHVNEAGPHGCLLLRSDDQGALTAEAIPLSPVRWETVRADIPQDIEDIPALENLLLERLAGFSPGRNACSGEDGLANRAWRERVEEAKPADLAGPRQYPPEAVLVRLTLSGRSELDHELRKNGAADALGEHLNAELDGTGVWIRDVLVDTRPLADLALSLQRPDLAGETLRTAFALRDDPASLALAAESCLAPLFDRPKLRKVLVLPQGEELARLAEEAALLCLDLLEGEQR